LKQKHKGAMDMAKKVNVYDCIVEQGDEVTKVLLTGTSAKSNGMKSRETF
jgi:hypothetical protein